MAKTFDYKPDQKSIKHSTEAMIFYFELHVISFANHWSKNRHSIP